MSESGRTATSRRRHVLVVGGSPDVRLAWCRALGNRGLDVSLLRWKRQTSPAEWSRHCCEALWLGDIDAGVSAWSHALAVKLGDGQYSDVLPVDALALAVLCDGRPAMPSGVALAGPQPSIVERGLDRLHMFELVREAGWSVRAWQHVSDPDTSLQVDRALVVRPRWNVRIIADKPARFSTRRVVDSAALDGKLRDDVPRGEVLLQSAHCAHSVRLCVAAHEGRVLGCWRQPAPPPQAGADEAPWHDGVRTLVQRLGWTGVLELEVELSDRSATLVDIHLGGDSGFAELVQTDRWASPGTHVRNTDLITLATRSAPHCRFDPMPRLAAPLMLLRAALAKAGLQVRTALAGALAPGRQPLELTPASSVLVVCKGNINRSIVAEQLLRAAGFERTSSAGLLDLEGRRPSRAAEAFLAETLNLKPGKLRSRSIRDALGRDGLFDAVLCFERRQLVEIADRYPELRGRVHLLGALAPALGKPVDIADPHGRSDEEYRACFERIRGIVASVASGARGASAGSPLHGSL